jgi:hypothetical protein
MTARMAESLTGHSEAGRMLSELHRENFFTNRYGGREPVYQYQPLFREFLLERAQAMLAPERRAEVQRAAATLLEEAGQIEDAAALLIAAESWASLGALIRRHAAALLAEGRGQTLLEWIGRMPSTVRDRESWVLYWQGTATLPLDPGGARLRLERALDGFRAQQDATGAFLACAAILETYIHESRDLHPLDRWIALFTELRAQFPQYPSTDIEARVVAAMLPSLYWRQPQHPEMAAWIERAEGVFRAHPSLENRLQNGLHLLGSYCWTGAFLRGQNTLRVLGPLADEPAASPLMRLMAKTFIGLYQWLTASLEASLQTTEEALLLARTRGVRVWDLHLLLYAAAVHLSRGDERAAGTVLDSIPEDLHQARPFDRLYHDFLLAWRALLRHDFAGASAAQKRSLNATVAMGVPLVEAQLRLLRVWIDLHRTPRPAADIKPQLANIHRMARETGSQFVHFSALLAEAFWHFAEGWDPQGMRCLTHAMRIGRVPSLLEAPGRAAWDPSFLSDSNPPRNPEIQLTPCNCAVLAFHSRAPPGRTLLQDPPISRPLSA